MSEHATYGNATTLRKFEEATEYFKQTGHKIFRSVGLDARGHTLFAPEPSSTPRLSATRSTAFDRGRRLAQLSRQIRLAQITRSLNRDARLVHLEQEIERAKVARRGSSSHFSVELYTAGPYSGPVIRSR